MPGRRTSIHILRDDLEMVRVGEVYSSWCGKRYIKEADPTPDEVAEIKKKYGERLTMTCPKCVAAKKRNDERGRGDDR